jgi:hypothetical protein
VSARAPSSWRSRRGFVSNCGGAGIDPARNRLPVCPESTLGGAGQSRKVTRFINKEKVSGIVEELPNEIIRLKLELDFVVTQYPHVAVTLPQIYCNLVH